MLLKDKKVLVVGVANKASIAWAITEALVREGAQVAVTYQGERLKDRVQALTDTLGPKPPLIDLDVTQPETVSACFEELDAEWGRLDGMVHSIAFAPKEALTPGIVKTTLDEFSLSLQISSHSLLLLLAGARPLFQKAGGGSVITLTYDTTKVYPNYNLMGVAKATLEANMRYAAWDMGRLGVRVNGVSAGPIKTLAARGISGFTKMLDEGAAKSPLGRNVTAEEVGNTSMFLLSDLASGITGQLVYVDAGQSIMGAAASE